MLAPHRNKNRPAQAKCTLPYFFVNLFSGLSKHMKFQNLWQEEGVSCIRLNLFDVGHPITEPDSESNVLIGHSKSNSQKHFHVNWPNDMHANQQGF